MPYALRNRVFEQLGRRHGRNREILVDSVSIVSLTARFAWMRPSSLAGVPALWASSAHCLSDFFGPDKSV